MTAKRLPPGLMESDFERIEEAVMETERGRWFLAEYAHRIRAESADGVFAALARIEEAVSWGQNGFATEAAEVARRLTVQAEEIEERLQDLAWRLREQKAEAACAAVEAEIFALRALTHRPAPLAVAPGAGFDPKPREGELSQRLKSIEQIAHAGQAPAELTSPVGASDGIAPAIDGVEDRRHEAFAAIEALPLQEKLAFFA